MKIMQVIPTLELAGAETMCYNLSLELTNMGHKVIVVSLYKKETTITKRLDDAGIETIYLDKKNGIDFGCIFRLIKIIRKINPDVVHSHLYAGKYAHIAAFLCNVKRRVYTFHSIATMESTLANKLFNRILFSALNVIPVALSEEVHRTILEVYHLKDNRVPIIYNGVPLARCKPIESYKDIATNFVHVGRFMSPKNHEGLVNAFIKAHEENPNIVLKLYGTGELLDYIKELVRKNKAEEYILFMGVTNDVYSVMSEADVFILPSLYEGVPMTLIEAMGTGLPIIATAVGGIVDMLEDKKDAVLTNLEIENLAESIKQLVFNKGYREQIGQNALKRALDFSAETMALKYIDVYSK